MELHPPPIILSNTRLVHDFAVNRTLLLFNELGYLTEKCNHNNSRLKDRIHVIATKKNTTQVKKSIHVYGLKFKTRLPLGDKLPIIGDLIFIWTNVLSDLDTEVFILSRKQFEREQPTIIQRRYHKTGQHENWLPVEVYQRYKDNLKVIP